MLRGLAAVAAAGLVYDLVITAGQLPAAARAVAAVPDLVFVLDHLAKPPIAAGRIEPWAEDLRRLAARPNTAAKLSGLVTEADWRHWTPADLRPYAETALDAFGPARLMFGSDWPVCTLAASYGDVLAAARDLTGQLSGGERAAVFGAPRSSPTGSPTDLQEVPDERQRVPGPAERVRGHAFPGRGRPGEARPVLVDSALSEALAPVLRDLKNSGGPCPEVRDRQWSDVPGQATAMLYGPDGSGQGVSAMAGEPLPDRIASVADQVQEWAVEALWHAGRPATWPECPEHPGSHPLAAQLREDRAVWTCPKTGHLICAVGKLAGPGR